jgi:hypothetical protein
MMTFVNRLAPLSLGELIEHCKGGPAAQRTVQKGTPMDPLIEKAGADAEAFAATIDSDGPLDVVYAALDSAMAAYVAGGGRFDEAVPGGGEGLGWGKGIETGLALWQRYVSALHDDLCKPDGELNKLLSGKASGAALVTSVVTLLGMAPPVAAVVAPLAGVMLAVGVRAFCQPTAEGADGAAAAEPK